MKYRLAVGSRLEGIYCGQKFVGTIMKNRQHTVDHRMSELRLTLDSPIIVFGDVRDWVIIVINDDGYERTSRGLEQVVTNWIV